MMYTNGRAKKIRLDYRLRSDNRADTATAADGIITSVRSTGGPESVEKQIVRPREDVTPNYISLTPRICSPGAPVTQFTVHVRARSGWAAALTGNDGQ